MTRRSAADGPDYQKIVDLENILELEFRNRFAGQPLDAELVAAAQRWSQTVWVGSEKRTSEGPSASDLVRGLALAQRPVFICGTQRSGTTLFRDLLDGHPQLVVIPTESSFYTGLEPLLFNSRPDQQGEYLARWWLERLVFPPPHWLLGRSCARGSPYVEFACNVTAWLRVSEQCGVARMSSWPLCALALAYAQHLGPDGIPLIARRWVEKSPTSERFLPRIWHDFPAAKVIHIVRRPEAVLKSYAALNRHAWGSRRAAAHCLFSIAPTYRIARQQTSKPSPDRYLLIRYEDLVTDRKGLMARVAEFLDIEALPALHQPTVAGRPALNNSSFDEEHSRRPLKRFERALLTLTVARDARALGYR